MINNINLTAMKKIVFALMLMMVVSFSASANSPMRRPGSINIQYFYDELAPYGDWIYSVDYGYVWRPYFDSPDYFRPYSSGGHWAYTPYGWTWQSDYNWGWATFHYGRWYFDDYLGWMWIPGYEWAPAWVSWGSYNDYWGWAPLGPTVVVGVATNWYAPDIWWTFVPRRHFCSSSWNEHIYHNRVNVTNITIINNVYVDNSNHHRRDSWYEGPRVNDVERYGHTRVRTNEVVDIQHPSDIRNSSNGRVNVYRPDIDRDNDAHRPSDFRRADDVRSSTRIQQASNRNDPGTNRVRNERPQTGRTGTGTSVNTGVRSSTDPAIRSTDNGRNNHNNGTTNGRYNRPDDSQMRRNDASTPDHPATGRTGNSTGTSTGSNRNDDSRMRRSDAATGNSSSTGSPSVRPINSTGTSTGSSRTDDSRMRRSDAATGSNSTGSPSVRPANSAGTSTGSNRTDDSRMRRSDASTGSSSSAGSSNVRTGSRTSTPSSSVNSSSNSSNRTSTSTGSSTGNSSRTGSTDNSKRVTRPGR